MESKKICSKCKQEKETSEFFNNKHSKDGKSNYCKICHTEEGYRRYEKYKEKKYYLKHQEKHKETKKIWYQKNKDRLSVIRKKYREDNKEKLSENRKEWYQKNREKKLKSNYENEKINMINNPMFRVKKNLRIRICKIIEGRYRKNNFIQLLGCTVEHLKKHLENQFDEKMTWDNYGSYWHVDHIKPCSIFNLIEEKEQMECFHYTNLRPLEANENLKKYNKIDHNE